MRMVLSEIWHRTMGFNVWTSCSNGLRLCELLQWGTYPKEIGLSNANRVSTSNSPKSMTLTGLLYGVGFNLEGLYFLRNGRLVHGTSGRSPSIIGRRPDRLWASLRRPLSKNHRQENINANCQPTLCHKTEFLMQRPIIRRDLREKGWILHAKECWAICCNQAHMMYN